MRTLDVDSLFTNMPLKETINIETNALFENTERVGLSKTGFQELLSFATKESCFVVNPFVPNAPFLYPLKTSENRKGERMHWERMG